MDRVHNRRFRQVRAGSLDGHRGIAVLDPESLGHPGERIRVLQQTGERRPAGAEGKDRSKVLGVTRSVERDAGVIAEDLAQQSMRVGLLLVGFVGKLAGHDRRERIGVLLGELDPAS